ncbi:hypothetical protein SXCC_02362 [Gluconacetobacter sp. SXCC-1]|nr:hypothetical protein SXCC_02362 [Gluconacetobacter sp. SXCC-1]
MAWVSGLGTYSVCACPGLYATALEPGPYWRWEIWHHEGHVMRMNWSGRGKSPYEPEWQEWGNVRKK